MAKLLLSCDEYVYRHAGEFYAASQEWADFFKRYLRVFDNLRLVCRCIDEPNIKSNRVKLDSRIEFIPLPMYRGPKEYAKTYFKLGRALKGITDGCDAALLRLPSQESIRVYPFVKKSGIPYATEIVYDAHDGYKSSESLVHKLLWKIIDSKMRSVCYNANGVSCVTEHYLQQRYFTKRVDGFSSHYSSLALPKDFYGLERKFPANKVLTIAHVANQVDFNGRKGHLEIIKAIAKLKECNLTVNVKFAGKDYLGGVAKLKEFAHSLGVGEQIEFMGFISRATLSELLDNADLFVLPTKVEGLPRVIIEAMSKGLPCISTNVSGNPELLDSYWLIDYNDVELLSSRIRELCTSKELYEKASSENFNNSCKYEASVLEKRRDEFYKQLKQMATHT